VRVMVRLIVAGLLAVTILANGVLAVAIATTSEPQPKPVTPERVATVSRPAVVLVQSNYTVTISIADFTIPSSKSTQLVNALLGLVSAGRLNPYDQAAVRRAAIHIILTNPDAYYVPGSPVHDHLSMVATGSGFFVTEDGYLVTAAHVVTLDSAELRSDVLAVAKQPGNVAQVRQEIAAEAKRALGYSMTASELSSMVSFFERWLDRYLAIDKIDATYHVATGTVDAGDTLAASGATASVVSIDPTSTGHDIAIMKADLSGVPTLPLVSGSPRVGESDFVLGYPRESSTERQSSLNASVDQRFTTGTVLRASTQKTGWTAWGTDAQMTHGSSGGPVVDANGKVLGIVSFGKVDASGKPVPGEGYFVPAEYIRADLASDSVYATPSSGGLTATYYHALAERDIHRYRSELGLLQQISSHGPWDGYVAGDIRTAKAEIAAGHDQTPPEFASYVPAAAIGSMVLVALAVAAWSALAIAAALRAQALTATTAEPVLETLIAEAQVIPPPLTWDDIVGAQVSWQAVQEESTAPGG
jgi:serine protease Do